MVVTALGIFEGTDGAFNAKKTFTRGAAATLLAKSYNTPKVWAELGPIYVSPFTDTDGSYAANGAGWAYALGFMSGTNKAGTEFSPARDITVLEYTGMLVKMLGYTLTENYKIDIIRFASESKLFSGITVTDPTAKVTFEQAAQITVNALKAKRVTNDRNQYTGQQYDVYMQNRTALLQKTQDTTSGYNGPQPVYYYGFETLYSDGINAAARDAFGYPGTALVKWSGGISSTSTKYITGFVPHYAVVDSFTAGLTAPGLAWAGDDTIYNSTYASNNAGQELILNGSTEPTVTSTYLYFMGATNVAVPNGTFLELVKYTEDSRELYKTIGIFESIILNDGPSAGPYAATVKLLAADEVKNTTDGIIATLPSTAKTFVLGVQATAAPTDSYAWTGKYLAAKAVTPVSITVKSYSNSAGTVSYTSDGAAKTAIKAGLTLDAYGATDLAVVNQANFIDGKVNTIIGEHGALHFIEGAKVATWTAYSATYLYVPIKSVATGAQGISLAAKQAEDGTLYVILEDGSVKNIRLTAKNSVINGNGKTNSLNLKELETAVATHGVFYEYVVQTDGTYALFALGGNSLGSAKQLATQDNTPTAGSSTATPGIWPALPNWTNAQYETAPGTALGITSTTTVKQVALNPAASASPEFGYDLATRAATGYQNIAYATDGTVDILYVPSLYPVASRAFLVHNGVGLASTDADKPNYDIWADKPHVSGFGVVTDISTDSDGTFYTLTIGSDATTYLPITKIVEKSASQTTASVGALLAYEGKTQVGAAIVPTLATFEAVSAAPTADQINIFVLTDVGYNASSQDGSYTYHFTGTDYDKSRPELFYTIGLQMS
jgi:hypothetical protein